jgi:hypothetical protein
MESILLIQIFQTMAMINPMWKETARISIIVWKLLFKDLVKAMPKDKDAHVVKSTLEEQSIPTFQVINIAHESSLS